MEGNEIVMDLFLSIPHAYGSEVALELGSFCSRILRNITIEVTR